MALIAAFRADTGIAICADAQETATCNQGGNPYDFRRSIQKIAPFRAGNCQVFVAGNGNTALIEAFVVHAKRRLQQDNLPSPTADNVLCTLEDELASFYRTDVVLCTDNDKGMKLFVAASCPAARAYKVWVSENTILRDIATDRAELIGWEYEMHHETARRLYAPNMTLSQAVLASIYTLTVARQQSNYVVGGLCVALIQENGIRMEDQDYVAAMEARLVSYESRIKQIFLACSDAEISPRSLNQELVYFQSQAQDLHKEQLNAEIRKLQHNKGKTVVCGALDHQKE